MRVIGNGSVVQRDKSKPRSRCRDWELSVKVDEGGRARRRTKAYHGTWTQAQQALKSFADELSGPSCDAVTVSGWFAMWTERRRLSGAYSERTLRTDREKLRPFVERYGDRLVRDVSREDVRDAYQAVMRGETPSGRKWSPHSVGRMRTCLGKMMRDAVDEGFALSNPTEGVPVPKRPRTSGRAMPPAQADALLSTLVWARQGHRAVALALGCGLRRSEVCALRWEDIRDGCVHVERSADDGGGDSAAKSDAGYRVVPMPHVVAAGLESARGVGKVVDTTPHSLSRWWRRNRSRLGCAGYRFHDLRHSYATRLAASGVHIRVAMELCGWASVDVAMRVYTHVADDMLVDAVARAFPPCGFRAGLVPETRKSGASAVRQTPRLTCASTYGGRYWVRTSGPRRVKTLGPYPHPL